MAAATGRRHRITVIDDHPEFLDLMREMLSDRYEVATFSGKQLTPDQIVDSRPDLLIVDLRLPAGDLQGCDIVALARAHRRLRAAPIIVCSADASGLEARAEEFLNAGNMALLSKPFALGDLDEIVRHGLTAGFRDGEFEVGRTEARASL